MTGTEDEVVEVELEAPAAEQSAPAPSQEPQDQGSEVGGDDELAQYSKGVQARIKKLTEKYRREERDKAEAVRLAQLALEENKKLQERLKLLDRGYVAEYGTRLNAQLDSVRKKFKDAADRGDSDAMFSAQEELTRLTTEVERHKIAKARVEREAAAPAQQPMAQPQAMPQAMPQAAPQSQVDPKAQAWASKHEWFFKDPVMTAATFALHSVLVDEEGFDPTSDEYYGEIERRLRAEFPQKFQAQQARPKPGGGVPVASGNSSASRNPTSGRRSVKLSPSQVAIATKLGVPLHEYAKYVKD